ncbi:hypothetical protein PPL_04952 [Heterostelium album PN500]|uniref:Uncharacterized protein n=1 Tax=Heterostelium pallidum (strain ATCC 26659 / Pp 5 / PN500) TaxID=670386 RepID=D3B908_HETP5|nr:hypothetical protein PPL_04952 [Heterostelium album PN500]EFA82047.1 hypothetical protein PPL_04952 [Heterostelium album PN500]|eukprot:XP_020434164.1 hypothetical protein PPL_04952 [Heterostelium album PN500]
MLSNLSVSVRDICYRECFETRDASCLTNLTKYTVIRHDPRRRAIDSTTRSSMSFYYSKAMC